MKPSQALFALWTMLMAVLAVSGCAENKVSSTDDISTGAKLALSANVAGSDYCMTGDIVFTGTSPVRAPITFPNSLCNNAPLTISFQPGQYEVTVPSPICTINNATPTDGYIGCELHPSPVSFTVAVGATTSVSLNIRYNYLNRIVDTLIGVGAGQVSVGTVTERDLCGPTAQTAVECTSNQTCATLDVDAATYACYTSCTTTNALNLNAGTCTGTGEFCVPVSGMDGISIIGVPLPPLSVPHVCAIVTPTSGTGGTSGAGGASGTGGTSSVAGSGSTGGSATNGGTSGVAGSSSVVGGASSTGGVTAAGGSISTGGTSSSGGATAQPGMTCSAAGVTVSCTIANCSQAAIICTDNGNGLVWGGCICLSSGTGGASSTGGSASTGGTSSVSTGGTTATGGTSGAAGSTGTPFPVACTAGQQVIRFDANNIVVGPGHDMSFPGSNAIRFEGMRVSLGTWGVLCSDLDSSNFTFTCVTSWASGLWEFQMYMPMAGAYGNEIYWGDRNYYGPGCPAQWGGSGSTLGTLTVAPCLDQSHPYTVSLVGNLTWRDPNAATHCEANEMLSYNGQVLIP